MSSRKLLRLTYVLAAMLPILLVAGVWWGGHPEDLPGFARRAGGAAETRVVDEAIERIASDYYRPIPTSALADASIAGAVASLHDRFSHYLSPSEFHEFDAPPHFTGIGVEVRPDTSGACDRARVRLLAGVARGAEGGRSDRRGQRAQARRALAGRGHRADQGTCRARMCSCGSKRRAVRVRPVARGRAP